MYPKKNDIELELSLSNITIIYHNKVIKSYITQTTSLYEYTKWQLQQSIKHLLQRLLIFSIFFEILWLYWWGLTHISSPISSLQIPPQIHEFLLNMNLISIKESVASTPSWSHSDINLKILIRFKLEYYFILDTFLQIKSSLS